jgi:carbohydrate kinase (thermoresistant glucokinase family)
MGVSGSGKTTLAEGLAARLDWEMVEGDRLHPPENVAKMRRGEPLDDSDRAPWLDRIGERLKAAKTSGEPIVVACSALKRAYRARLLAARPDLVFVYLKAARALLEARVQARHHEYMPASLLDSQLATLEEPGPDEPAIVVDAALSAEAEVEAALEKLALNDPAAT